MKKIFMLVGIPGSGKSTWAEKNKGELFTKVFSNDEYRKKVLGNENDQTGNNLIFTRLYNDLLNSIRDGDNVCFDATNVTRKDRRGIINIGKQVPNTEIIGVLFMVSENLLFQQNNNREKRVPDEVITKFINRFEMPFEGEGFSSIYVVYHSDGDLPTAKDIESIMKGFNQNNHHHTLDLLEHCNKCAEIVAKETDDKQLTWSLDEKRELVDTLQELIDNKAKAIEIKDNEVEFTVKCKMNKRWVPTFMRMLKTMESFGTQGHSEFVGLYSDGDGDFRPEFKSDIEYDSRETHLLRRDMSATPKGQLSDGTFYDAG